MSGRIGIIDNSGYVGMTRYSMDYSESVKILSYSKNSNSFFVHGRNCGLKRVDANKVRKSDMDID